MAAVGMSNAESGRERQLPTTIVGDHSHWEKSLNGPLG
jgi:hypothetical protein